MTRRIYEPSIWGQAAKNSFGVKSLKQRPEAFRWWMPDCDDTVSGITCTGEEPLLTAAFSQPADPLEKFAFRLNSDGLIQTKGVLDASGAASGDIAWTMPGVNPGEVDFIPPTGNNDSFNMRVTTTGDDTGITPAVGLIDKVTGDVTISWASASPVQVFRAGRFSTNLAVGSGGSQITVAFDTWDYCNTSVFCPLDEGLASDPTPGVDKVPRIRLGDCGTGYADTVPGTYDIYFAASCISGTFDGDIELALHDGDDTWAIPDAYYHSLRSGFGTAYLSAMWSKVYPIWDYLGGGETSVAELSFTIAQINAGGTSKNFRPCWLEIHFNPHVSVCA